MGAYNKVNGTYACEHRELLRGVLKGEWGFDGAVISDWFAVAGRAGLRARRPRSRDAGPAAPLGPEARRGGAPGEVPEADSTRWSRRMLRLRERTGALEAAGAPEPPERAEDRPEHRALAREAAVESIVLLRNEGGALPLAARAPSAGSR